MCVALLFVNIFLSNYYKFAQVRPVNTALKIASLRAGKYLVGYATVSLLIYFALRTIVYRVYQTVNTAPASTWQSSFDPITVLPQFDTSKVSFKYDIKFFSAFAAPFVFLSSLVFAVAGGIGMAALPLSLIQQFIDRPVAMTAQQEVLTRKILLSETEKAIKLAQKIRDVERDMKIVATSDKIGRFNLQRKLQKKHNIAKEAWLSFEETWEAFNRDYNILNSNPLHYWGALILGSVFLVLSLLFFVNATLSIAGWYVVFEWVLNRSKQRYFFFGVATLFLISVYFCLGIMAGSVRISRRFHGFLNSYPLRKNGTFTHTFFWLINAMLLGIFGMTLHVIRTLPFFLRFSEFDFLFNKLIVHIFGFHFLFQYKLFEWVFVALFLLTAASYFTVPSASQRLRALLSDREAEFESQKAELMQMQAADAAKAE